MKTTKEQKFALLFLLIIAIMVFIGISGCKKKDNKPSYEITYTFYNTHTPKYLVQIWDGTGLNDFSDSISAPSFSKTVTYDYSATYRCRIDNSNSSASKTRIDITYNGVTTTCQDSIYPSLECFRSL